MTKAALGSPGRRARFESGVVAVFNERFRGRDSTASGRASASVPLRPDVVLHRCDGGFHVLDAKFRRAGIDSDRDDEAAEGEDAAKQADIHKMHAYRDALGARSARVLYPCRGSAAEFAPYGLALDTELLPPESARSRLLLVHTVTSSFARS
jgi:predicted component of viral defense system (DUF524 family)